ncbi:hypothetical protein [Bradyrhizobium cenepequi]
MSERDEELAAWISYAEKLERALELICGTSKDKLIQLQAADALRLVKPIPSHS